MSAETPARRKRSAKEAAKLLGVSERTIRNLVAEPRQDYLRRAAEQRKRAVELRTEGLKYKQIAEKMGISIGVAGSLIHHARKHGEMD
ncbi:sigma factor-like helix-turn-helix DNA-binding protein [Rhodococcus marinonascens]|uniref:sigma-70 region 4 domain-containing protein n=1 Tax=Rhodococcus marinonascens TaxID=38311 RepID=UPI00093439F1|nr:sigma-70 region 4 domain-containing protein [Rhodococcus marinonascens]